MPFVHSHWKEEFSREYVMPEGLADLIKNYKIFYDEESRSALISHPLHYSDYPDKSYTFLTAGYCLGVSEKAAERTPKGMIPRQVLVHIGNKSLDRSLVIDTLRNGLAAMHGLDEFTTPISIAPRYKLPKRPPLSAWEWFKVLTIISVYLAFVGFGISRMVQ